MKRESVHFIHLDMTADSMRHVPSRHGHGPNRDTCQITFISEIFLHMTAGIGGVKGRDKIDQTPYGSTHMNVEIVIFINKIFQLKHPSITM